MIASNWAVRRRRGLGLFVLGSIAFGCNSILGIEEYGPRASAGSNGVGGTVAGSSSRAGEANAAGDLSAGAEPGGSGNSSGALNGGRTGNGGSGAGPSAGSPGNGGKAGSGGSDGNAGDGGTGTGSELGTGTMIGSGNTTEQYGAYNVTRNGVPYRFIPNGWGPMWQSHEIAWDGTSFIVESLNGAVGAGLQPAGYPSVFCGKYSDAQVASCGLPAPKTSLTALRTGWRWAKNGNNGQYSAAFDIWLGNGSAVQSYLTVWLRDPAGQQPPGSLSTSQVTVANVPGTWDIWKGVVGGVPIVSYVRAEGSDSLELEFDVLDLIRDGTTRALGLTGTHVQAVAVGFQVWAGPITNLESVDFYVDVE